MTRHAAIWVGFAILMAHNAEELVEIGPFLAAHRAALPPFLGAMTTGRFAISVSFASLLMFAIAWAADRGRISGPGLTLGIGMHVAMGANALQHTAVAIWTRGYAPGVVTGVALVLPYAAWLSRRALRDRWVSPKPLCLAAVVLILLTGPLILALHSLSALLV